MMTPPSQGAGPLSAHAGRCVMGCAACNLIDFKMITFPVNVGVGGRDGQVGVSQLEVEE